MVNEIEYHKILFELGLLDDEEDWELYKLQEKQFDVADDLYLRYMNNDKPLRLIPNEIRKTES